MTYWKLAPLRMSFAIKKCVFTYISPQNLSHLSQKRKPQGESKPLSKRLFSETFDRTFDRFLAADGDLVAAEARYHWKCSCLFHKHYEINDDRSQSEVDTALLKTFEMLEQNRTKIWNKVELMELYEQNGGTTMSRRALLENVEGQFGDDIVIFHSKVVATLVVFKDNVASMLNIVHTKDDDEVTLKELGKETSQESRTVKEELKSYQDCLVMIADMQIYKIIVNIIFATPDLRTKVIHRPIFERGERNNMAG